MPFVTFQAGDFFGFGVLDGEAFGDALTLLFNVFAGLPSGGFEGAGALVDRGFGDGLLLCFGGSAGFATGVAVGVGVLAGGGFGDGLTLTLGALDFSRVRCCDSCSSVVGNAIAVGSSTAVGRLTGVGAAVGEPVTFGGDAVSGNNKRPRLCETVGDTDGPEIGVELAIGTGTCEREVVIIPMNKIENAKYFRIRQSAFLSKGSRSVRASVWPSECHRA